MNSEIFILIVSFFFYFLRSKLSQKRKLLALQM